MKKAGFILFFVLLSGALLRFSLNRRFQPCPEDPRRLSLKTEQKKDLLKQADQCLKQKAFKPAIFILERLLSNSRENLLSPEEIQSIEEQIADMAFYKTQHYNKALKHYTRLLSHPLNTKKRFKVQYQIASSFFLLGKNAQALREIEKCFSAGMSLEERKSASFLKIRTLLAERYFDRAMTFISAQMTVFPEEEIFFREYRALIYEERGELGLAIKELQQISQPSDFIQNKILHLTSQQKARQGLEP